MLMMSFAKLGPPPRGIKQQLHVSGFTMPHRCHGRVLCVHSYVDFFNLLPENEFCFLTLKIFHETTKITRIAGDLDVAHDSLNWPVRLMLSI